MKCTQMKAEKTCSGKAEKQTLDSHWGQGEGRESETSREE